MTDMLQKSENVAKNVANENSQDLTAQWEKRTLRNGAYYIKMLGGDILPAFCNTEYILKQFQTMKGIYDNVAEVLAPVPSYEEWQAKLEENAQLKDLLEECRSPINYALCLNLSEEEKIEFRNLLSKIKRALGEDK